MVSLKHYWSLQQTSECTSNTTDVVIIRRCNNNDNACVDDNPQNVDRVTVRIVIVIIVVITLMMMTIQV